MKRNTILLLIIVHGFIVNGQTFYSEDFSAGIPAGWTNVDNSGNNVLWRTTTTGATNTGASVDYQLSTAGTTALNGYLIIDSDSAGQSVTQDAVLTTASINCTGHSSVHLSFNEYYAQYLYSTGNVEVSNDNSNWTGVYQAHAGLGLNEGTSNPNHVVLDITSIAANQPTVYIRFSYHGEWDYWWFVDDLAVLEPAAIDLAAVSIEKMTTEYTLIPVTQASALNLSAEVRNDGGTSATGGTALFEIVESTSSNVVFTESINVPVIAPGGNFTVIPASPFTPPGPGDYYSRVTVSISGDTTVANNSIASASISVSDSVYARDDDNFAGTQGIGVGAGLDAITGQNFLVNTLDHLTSITFFLDDGFGAATGGTPVYFTVHPQASDTVNPDDAVLVATSETLLVMPGTIPSGGAYFTLGLQGGPVQLSPGLYYVGIHETDSILTIGYTNSIYTPGAVWVHWIGIPTPPAINGWAHAEDFTIEIAYMIRANFGGGFDYVSELNAGSSLQLYPNPSSGLLHFRLDGYDSNRSLNISLANMLGQQVYSGSWNGKDAGSINVESIPPGMYEILVWSDEMRLSGKIAIIE